VLLGEFDVDLVFARFSREIRRRAVTVLVVDARQLSLGRTLDGHRQTTYIQPTDVDSLTTKVSEGHFPRKYSPPDHPLRTIPLPRRLVTFA